MHENEEFSHKLVIFIVQKQGILSVQRMKSACRSPVGDELCVWSHLLPSTRDLSSSLRTEPVHTAPSRIFFIENRKENGRKVHFKLYKFSHFKGWLVYYRDNVGLMHAQSTPVPLLSLMNAPSHPL
jgi:hypothetical protein